MTTDFGNEPVRPVGSRKTNTLAIVSLVCSVLSLLTCCIPEVGIFVCIGLAIVGAVLGYVAMGQIKRTGEQGHGLALAGAIIGAVIAVISIVLMILALVVGVAALQFLQNQQNLPGVEQPGEIDIFEEEGELGAPMETPDAPEDIVPEPVTPDATDSASDPDTPSPEPAN